MNLSLPNKMVLADHLPTGLKLVKSVKQMHFTKNQDLLTYALLRPILSVWNQLEHGWQVPTYPGQTINIFYPETCQATMLDLYGQWRGLQQTPSKHSKTRNWHLFRNRADQGLLHWYLIQVSNFCGNITLDCFLRQLKNYGMLSLCRFDFQA